MIPEDPPFPAIGHVYEANFGSWVFHLYFKSKTVMTITNVAGPLNGTSETVQIAVTLIRPGVFMISWQEADKTTVVHIQDFENGIVHTNVTEPNGVFITPQRHVERGAVTVSSVCHLSLAVPIGNPKSQGKNVRECAEDEPSQ